MSGVSQTNLEWQASVAEQQRRDERSDTRTVKTPLLLHGTDALTLLNASSTEERREPPAQDSLLCPPATTDLLRRGLGWPGGRRGPAAPAAPASPATMPCVSSAIMAAMASTAAAWCAGCLDLARRAASRPATTGPPGWMEEMFGSEDIHRVSAVICNVMSGRRNG